MHGPIRDRIRPARFDGPAENHDYDRLFGILNLAEAKTHGYHMPGDVILDSGESMGSKRPMSAAELDTLFMDVAMGDGSASKVNEQAVPEGGCITEARSRIGDVGASQRLNEAAINYGLDQSDRDPRVIAAFDSWSACMNDRGFAYGTPGDAGNDPRWSTSMASQTEIHVATADIECKLKTNLTGVRVAVASAWQTEYITSHKAEFEAVEAGYIEQLANADALLKE